MKQKYRRQPVYFLTNNFGEVIGAHFRRLAVVHHGVEEAWGIGEVQRILPADKLLGMTEETICRALERRLRAIGFRVTTGEAKLSLEELEK